MADFVIDRFEDGDWAVLESTEGVTLTVPRCWLPTDAREGDALAVNCLPPDQATTANTVRFVLDPEARDALEAAVRARHDRLRRGPAGDISL